MMTELDRRWAAAVLTACPQLIVDEPSHMAHCCCGEPLVIDGESYDVVNAGCQVHGVRSRIGSRRAESQSTITQRVTPKVQL